MHRKSNFFRGNRYFSEISQEKV